MGQAQVAPQRDKNFHQIASKGVCRQVSVKFIIMNTSLKVPPQTGVTTKKAIDIYGIYSISNKQQRVALGIHTLKAKVKEAAISRGDQICSHTRIHYVLDATTVPVCVRVCSCVCSCACSCVCLSLRERPLLYAVRKTTPKCWPLALADRQAANR